jgi:hypothetical protein
MRYIVIFFGILKKKTLLLDFTLYFSQKNTTYVLVSGDKAAC